MSSIKNKKGFSLVEAVVSIGILMIFATGVYGGIQLVFQVVFQSRLRIIESAILTEQMEIARNMSFFDVGIVLGSPSGLLERTININRSGIDFTVVRTVRNIDDPFDGTIDAEPLEPPDGKVFLCHNGSTLSVGQPADQGHLNHGDTAGPCAGDPEAGFFDQSPADYKLFEVSVICDECGQNEPLTASTLVGPKFLEGDPTHGALFVEVIDANAQPVEGATIGIKADTGTTTYDFEDTTGNDGILRIVDLAGGIGVYEITVTKDGYTTDVTTSSVANPVKPHASVVAQDVTSRTFSIDALSSITLSAQTAQCTAVPSAGGTLAGARLIGTDPDVLLIDQSFTTDGAGLITFSDIPWDTYSIVPVGYDLAGTIPALPLSVLPGAASSLSMVLAPASAHSLLVQVEDASTGDPVASSTVEIHNGTTQTKVTGIGTIRQTDWSGGAGQTMYVDDTSFAADDGNLMLAGDITLAPLGFDYVSDGWLESSTFSLGDSTNYVDIEWSPTAQPTGTGTTSVRMQFASSNSSTPATWDFVGPDGTANTYYDTTDQTLSSVHAGDAFARYKVYLSTASSTLTPTVSDIAFTYVASCIPPGQAYFGALLEETYTVTVQATGYTETTIDVPVTGDVFTVVPLSEE